MSGRKPDIKNLLLNPGLIGTILGMVFFICSVTLPRVIGDAVNYIAAMNTPLCMMAVGYRLTHIAISSVFNDRKSWLLGAERLLILPLCALAIMFIFNIRGTVAISCMIAASAPAAAVTTMFATKFKQNYELSVKVISMQTILSAFTMTLVIGLAKMVL